MHLAMFVLIGLLAGWLAGKLTKGRGFGCAGDIAVGVIGSLVGGFVFRLLGFEVVGMVGSLISATVGGILLVLVVHAVMKD